MRQWAGRWAGARAGTRAAVVGRIAFLAAFLAALATLPGCRIERDGSHVSLSQERRDARLNRMITPEVLPPTSVDESALVLRACGPPSRDVVEAVYSKLEHGPVRLLQYLGREPVTLIFVPSDPEPHHGRRLMPAASGHPPLLAALPPNTVWDFEEATANNQELLVADRLHLLLPCAANALANTSDE